MKQAALVVAVAALGTAAAQPVSRPFRSHAEVAVRTVRVVLTTRDGKPLSRPPSPNDFEVTEGGKRAEVLDVERLFTTAEEDAGAAPSAGAPAAPGADAAANAGVRQVVYVETTLLSTPAVREAARVLDSLAPRLVERGAVEIVLANPDPTPFLPPTRDLAALRAATSRLSANVAGKDMIATARIQDANDANALTTSGASRQQVMGKRESEKSENVQARMRETAETTIILAVLDRLTRWTSAQEPRAGSVFVFVTNGFDLDPALASEKMRGADASRPRVDLRGPDERIAQRLRDSSALLASRGFAAFPLAVDLSRFSGMAADGSARKPIDADASPSSATLQPVYSNAIEPLARVAAATGGEVSTTGDRLGTSLSRLAESFVLTYHSARPADGKVYDLSIRSTRPDVQVRAPSSIAVGTPESAAQALVIGLLSGAAAPPELAVEPKLDAAGPDKKPAMLRLRIRLGQLPELLAGVGKGRLRVSVAVAHGTATPFVQHMETPLEGSGEGRIYVFEAPIAGTAKGDRVAVLVEELETGFAGGATLTVGAPAT